MQKNRTSFLGVLAIAAMSLLGGNVAFASSYIHSTNTEKGYVTYPDHFKSERSRADVQAEAAEFVKKGGSDAFRGGNYPARDVSPASTKTRAEVINELRNMSPAERKAMSDLYRG